MSSDDPIAELEFLALREQIQLLQRQIVRLQKEVELLYAALDQLVKSTNQWP